MEKYFKQKLHRIKFATKNSVDAYLYLPLDRRQGLQKFSTISMHYNISKTQIFVALQLHSRNRQRYASAEFFVANLILCNFCLKHLSIQSTFFAAFDSKIKFFITMHFNFSKIFLHFSLISLHLPKTSFRLYRITFKFLLSSFQFNTRTFSQIFCVINSTFLKNLYLILIKVPLKFYQFYWQSFGAYQLYSQKRQKHAFIEFFIVHLILNHFCLKHFLI